MIHKLFILGLLLIVLLANAPLAFAAIVLDSNGVSTNGTGDNTSTVSWSHVSQPTGSNGLVVVYLSREGTGAPIPNGANYTATFGGNAMTFVPASGAVTPDNSLAVGAWYYQIGNTGGSQTVALNFPSLNGNVIATAVTFWGVDQTNPINSVFAAGQAGSTSQTNNITTTGNNVTVVDFIAENTGDRTFIAGAGQTQIWNDTVGAGPWGTGGAMSTELVPTAGVATMSWTINSAPLRQAQVLVGLNAAVPEPASIALLVLGGIGLLGIQRHRRAVRT